jgi:hypothetical protein
MNDEALAIAIKKVRKLRMVGHVAVKDAAPPALTFLAIMKSGLGGLYEDAALEFLFRRFISYYEGAQAPDYPGEVPFLRRQLSLANGLVDDLKAEKVELQSRIRDFETAKVSIDVDGFTDGDGDRVFGRSSIGNPSITRLAAAAKASACACSANTPATTSACRTSALKPASPSQEA